MHQCPCTLHMYDIYLKTVRWFRSMVAGNTLGNCNLDLLHHKQTRVYQAISPIMNIVIVRYGVYM